MFQRIALIPRPGVHRSGRGAVVFVAVLLVILCAAAIIVLNRGPDAGVVESGAAAASDPSSSDPAPTPTAPATTTAQPVETQKATASQSPPVIPLFEGWDQPAAVLMFTGEQHGHLEPCGCTAGQVGGLARRVDLVRMLTEDKKWPVASFDVGGVLRDDRAKRPQESIKFETTRAAMALMQYDAQALGTEELRLGADNLFTLYSDEQGRSETRPRFVCANITLFEERSDNYSLEIPEQFRIVTVGGLKIAVTAVIGDDSWKSVFPGGLTVADTLFAFEPPPSALHRVIPLMQAEQPDLMVLLSHCSADTTRDLAAQFPRFDLVVTAGGPEDGERQPGMVGEAPILEVGQKGKAAGVVGIFPGAEEKLRFQLVELNGRQFKHSPRMHELFAKYVQQLDAQHPALQEGLGAHPSGAQYVGADSCQECHEDAYDIWKNSKHAHAFDSLTTGRPDPEDDDIFVVRTRDPECITCHATGWDPLQFARYDSAFVDMESTPQLAGSQCENCHGPGSTHVELEQAWKAAGDQGDATAEMAAARQQLHLDQALARENLCIHCHDHENSPSFDSEEKPFKSFWWSQVAH